MLRSLKKSIVSLGLIYFLNFTHDNKSSIHKCLDIVKCIPGAARPEGLRGCRPPGNSEKN